ncbi:hypothetical protein ACI65C_000291 [Semiaphis heraclei]
MRKDEEKLTILPIYTTIEQQILSENLTKTDIIFTKSHGLEDQNEKEENFFESGSNLMKVLNANNNDNNIKNDSHLLNYEAMTKDMVISAIDNLMIDLSNHARGKSTTFLQPAVQKTHRDDNQTNNTAFRSAVLNDNQSEKFITATQLYDLEDQREEEVELESENFKTILNPIPLHVNNNTENILDGEKLTKNEVISTIDGILIDITNDVKVELTTIVPRPEEHKENPQRTHREGVRMNTTALRREMHIKKRLQNNKHK